MVAGNPSAAPSIQVNPTRGEIWVSDGIWSVRTPKRESTAGLNAGAPEKLAPSSRAPYAICRAGPVRHVSPRYIAVFQAVPACWRGARVLVYRSGWLAASAPRDG